MNHLAFEKYRLKLKTLRKVPVTLEKPMKYTLKQVRVDTKLPNNNVEVPNWTEWLAVRFPTVETSLHLMKK